MSATHVHGQIVLHSGPKADAMPLAMSIERRQQSRRRELAAV
jgi:hypothetical protein